MVKPEELKYSRKHNSKWWEEIKSMLPQSVEWSGWERDYDKGGVVSYLKNGQTYLEITPITI